MADAVDILEGGDLARLSKELETEGINLEADWSELEEKKTTTGRARSLLYKQMHGDAAAVGRGDVAFGDDFKKQAPMQMKLVRPARPGVSAMGIYAEYG